MDIKNLILEKLNNNNQVKASDMVKATGFSRKYIHRFLKELQDEGKIVLIGKANQARYVRAQKDRVEKEKAKINKAQRILINKNLSEDVILAELKKNTGIFLKIPSNVSTILDYAFTEIVNNAIDHSKSDKIKILISKSEDVIKYEVRDWGIGIFNNIKKKKKLKTDLEAIQELTKGKQTTAPKEHSGEGIFFTSKVADILTIKSFSKSLRYDNIIDDIFISDSLKLEGTSVTFSISLTSKKNLNKIFRKYTGDFFEFGKTEVAVKLYKMDTIYVSRSQARRIVTGLEKFKSIILDFNKVETIGQGFADEIFRVWQRNHPKIKISYTNTNENVVFMIKRALGELV